MSREKTGLRGFRPGLTQTKLLWAVQQKKMARGFKSCTIYSENKGADQLRTTDLHLFSHLQKLDFLMMLLKLL